MNKRLMRTWYKTDADPSEPDYVGAFSDTFPAPDDERRIVDVDWSVRGEVQVTYIIPADF